MTHRVAQSFSQAVLAALEPIAAPGGPSSYGAHEARRNLKRARATLRLMQPAFSDEAFADEDALLRGCARSVAGMRDADVLLETLVRFRKRFARSCSIDEVAALERFIRTRREAARPNPGALSGSVRLLRGTAERLRLRMQRPVTSSLVGKALRTIYRRGRKAYESACATSTAEPLHRFRKHAKYFANAVDALDDAVAGRQSKRARLAARIGDWLGEHHDLEMLDRAMRNSDFIPRAARKTLRGLLEKRQRKLRRRALEAGRRLYAARPRRIAALP